MSEELASATGIAALVFLLFALFAGYGIGSIAYRNTVTHMRRSARFNLALLALMGMTAAIIISIFLYAVTWSPSLIWNTLLYIPLVMAPLAAVIILALPRLLQLARLVPDNRHDAASRTKRRAAADVRLVVPVQSLTIGALVCIYLLLYPLPVPAGTELLIITLVMLSAAALLAWRQSIRRRRIHRDDGTSLIHSVKRISVYTSACGLIVLGITYPALNVKQGLNSLNPNRGDDYGTVDFGISSDPIEGVQNNKSGDNAETIDPIKHNNQNADPFQNQKPRNQNVGPRLSEQQESRIINSGKPDQQSEIGHPGTGNQQSSLNFGKPGQQQQSEIGYSGLGEQQSSQIINFGKLHQLQSEIGYSGLGEQQDSPFVDPNSGEQQKEMIGMKGQSVADLYQRGLFTNALVMRIENNPLL
ncbi:hypothetical protein K0T92_06765 [Paenibacillus oenotherae]|uniref:Uncharacterized protein n=1 Tax=Paenibacillus oenotherae TaxID=1435645 RepID=A0ABS7D3D2_9BACL|nr:hypothetical protein [Paenibacillus oenotherae]MBW7474442.1 hypothetical protein [Paenibacillus oenotherae]